MIHAAVFFLILTVGACMMVIYRITMNKNSDLMRKIEQKVNGKPALQRRIEAEQEQFANIEDPTSTRRQDQQYERF